MKKSPKQRSTLKDRVRRIFKTNELCQIAFEELENDIEVQTTLEDRNDFVAWNPNREGREFFYVPERTFKFAVGTTF